MGGEQPSGHVAMQCPFLAFSLRPLNEGSRRIRYPLAELVIGYWLLVIGYWLLVIGYLP